jgi:hypothetical protein
MALVGNFASHAEVTDAARGEYSGGKRYGTWLAETGLVKKAAGRIPAIDRVRVAKNGAAEGPVGCRFGGCSPELLIVHER